MSEHGRHDERTRENTVREHERTSCENTGETMSEHGRNDERTRENTGGHHERTR